MGYGSNTGSQYGRDEDDEEDYEEAGGSNRLLGFMFGNVDNSDDLDVYYLDELSVKSPQTLADIVEQVYGEKVGDAVDYEDIDEQYEGPEVQAASEEDYEDTFLVH